MTDESLGQGPTDAADKLVAGHGRWQEPWIES